MMCAIPSVVALGVSVVDIVLYVSVNGSDGNAGTSAALPLATPGAAQRAAARLRPGSGARVTVSVGPGTYFLPEPLHITANDSGLRFVGEGSTALPVFSAGRPIRFATHPSDRRLLVANFTPPINATGMDLALYINGQRRSRARLPAANEKYLRWDVPLVPCANPSAWSPTCPDIDGTGFVFKGSDLSQSMYDISSVRIGAVWAFTRNLYSIASVFPANRTVLFNEHQPGNNFGMYTPPLSLAQCECRSLHRVSPVEQVPRTEWQPLFDRECQRRPGPRRLVLRPATQAARVLSALCRDHTANRRHRWVSLQCSARQQRRRRGIQEH